MKFSSHSYASRGGEGGHCWGCLKDFLLVRIASILLVITFFGGAVLGAITTYTHDPNGNQTSQQSAAAAAPAILSHPVHALLTPGGTVRFSVVAGGPGPLTYQWQADNVDIPQATSDTLQVSGLAIGLSVYPSYRVIVTNATGSVTSNTATVRSDSDSDGMPDVLENQYFFNLTRLYDADADFDGVSNGDEMIDGTNPANSTSRFYRLTTTAEHGSIDVTPASATGRYPPNAVLTLTAAPHPGYQFDSWSGALGGTQNPQPLTMTGPLTAVAQFSSPLGRAVDAPQLTWTTGEQAPWLPVTDVSQTGGSSARSGALPGAGNSWVSTYVTGPTAVSFWWKISAAGSSRVRFYVDDDLVTQVSGTQDWVQASAAVGPGSHLLFWKFEKTLPDAAGSDAAWLDKVQTGLSSVPLATALDAPAIEWTTTTNTGSTGVWTGFSSPNWDGVDAAGSGVIPGGYSSSLFGRLPAPGRLSFRWRTSSRANEDRLSFWYNGIEQASRSGETQWARRSEDFAACPLLEWRYAKDTYQTSGADQGYVDTVEFDPYPQIPMAEALDSGPLAWTTGGSQPWTAIQHSTAQDTSDLAVSGGIGDGKETWLETTVTGSGKLSFWWKTSTQSSVDALSFMVDGVTLASASGNSAWNQRIFEFVGSGSHTLRWRYAKNASTSSGLDTVWLDQVSFTPAPDLPLAQALDSGGLPWTTGGTAGWFGFGLPFANHDGTDAARSSTLGDNQDSWMETTVTGPGTVNFLWKVSSDSADRLSVAVDGTVLTSISGELDWKPVALTVGSGTHVIRWRYAKDASFFNGLDAAWVDEVSFIPEPAAALADAVDRQDLTWLSTGDVVWQRQATISHDGSDAARSGTITHNQRTRLETRVTGPARVDFWWKVSSESEGDYLELYLDESFTPLASISGDVGWELKSVNIPAGTHLLSWSYTKNWEDSAGEDAAWLDEVVVTPIAPLTLAAGLDTTGLNYTLSGNAQWSGQGGFGHDGVDSVRSGQIADSQQSTMETTVTGPGRVTFWWKVSSEQGYDYLRFYLNGTLQSSISGEVSWQERTFDLPAAGTYTLRWIYSKDSSYAEAEDAGWVDQLVFTPAPATPLATALDTAPSQTWTTGGNAPWLGLGLPSLNHDGSDAAASGDINDNGESWLETTVPGPGSFSFWWRVSSQSSVDFLSLTANGATLASISGETAWQQATFNLTGPGPHVLRWRYFKNANTSIGSDMGWVDEFVFTPAAQTPLDAVFDGVDLAWSAGGDAAWAGYTHALAGSHDSVDAGLSGRPADGGQSWVETTVTGPGRVNFWWKVSSQRNSDFFTLLVDGEQRTAISGELPWQPAVTTLGPGPHTLRWRYQKDASGAAGSDVGFLDEVSFTPEDPPLLVDAFDAATLDWTSGGAALWSRQTTLSHDLADAGQSPAITHAQDTWVETIVTGPGRINFWWKVSSQAAADQLAFSVDGNERAAISGEVDWQPVIATLGEGRHVLRWRYSKDASGSSGSDAAWLDELSFVAGSQQPLAEAVDAPAMPWTSGGQQTWIAQTADSHDASDAAQSPPLTDGRDAWLETRVSGPGVIDFWWKVSSEAGADLLSFSIDGVVQHSVSGEVAWESRNYQITGPGEHVLRWRYAKNAGLAAGLDAAWLDQVSFTPAPSLPLAAALDGPGLLWTTGPGPAAAWQAFGPPFATHDGVDAAASADIGDSSESWTETTVSGPGTLSFWWKLSSQTGDALALLVDGQQLASITGEVGWQQQSFVITTPGNHVLRWRYLKDAAGSAGTDAGSLDEVSFVPAAPQTLAAALDGSGLSWTSGGQAPWSGFGPPSPNHDAADAAASGDVSDGGQSWVETTVSGPGRLAFWWRLSSQAGDTLSVTVDGVPLAVLSGGEVNWQQQVFEIPGGGSHVLRWVYAKDSAGSLGMDMGWLDEVSFGPATPQPLATALDGAGLTWTTGGDGSWAGFGVPFTNHDGIDAARTMPIADGAQTWIETTVTGPGTLTFWWKVSSQASADFLTFSVNGASSSTFISGETAWQSQTIALPNPGSQTLRWTYAKNASFASGADTAWLDEVVFTPAPTMPLADALDGSGMTWTPGGDLSWTGLGPPSLNHSTGDAALASRLGHGQQAWMETTIAGPGTLSFWWKVSSQAGADLLTFTVDGQPFAAISGEQDWQVLTATLGSGEHVLRWRYAKDAGGSAGSDAAWLDQVAFTPEAIPLLADACDAAAQPWISSGALAWTRQTTAPTHDGADAGRSGVITHNQESWMETRITGAGRLSFWWKVSSQASADLLSFSVDGVERSVISGEIDWQQQSFEILGAGTHTLRWRYAKNASLSTGSDAGWVDEVAFTPALPVTLATALDGAGMIWTSGGDNGAWAGFGPPFANHDGSDAARSASTADNKQTWLQTSVTGPGVIDFWWKVSSEPFYDRLILYVDGQEYEAISGEQDWSSRQVILGAGSHTLRWTYLKNGSISSASDGAWLDQVGFTPAPALALDASLDGSGLVWANSGGAPWAGFGPPFPTSDGVDAAASGDLGDLQQSVLATTVTGPGQLTFRWKVSSEEGYDFFTFLANGSTQGSISGEQGWSTVTLQLGTGTHQLEWRYAKDVRISSGADTAWLDQVTFVAAPPLTLAEALDGPALTWTTGGAAPWSGFGPPSPNHDGADAAASGKIAKSQQSWVQTTVTGPGLLSYWSRISANWQDDFLSFTIDGEEQSVLFGGSDWQQNTRYIGSGTHTLRWIYQRGPNAIPAGLDSAWLDSVSFVPVGQVNLATALDAPGFGFTTGGSAPWSGVVAPAPAYEGTSSAATGLTGNDGSSWLETTLTGPGTLNFRWMASSEEDYDFLRLTVDGMERAAISGETDWLPLATTLGPGEHVIRWTYTKDDVYSSGSDAGWLDSLSFTPGAPPLVVSLDGDALEWTTSGTTAWTAPASDSHDGVDAARSGPISEFYDLTWLETRVSGAGELRFWWKVSSNEAGGFFDLELNGRIIRTISGEVGWQEVVVPLGPGDHVLRWTYSNEGDLAFGVDAGWLDQVSFQAGAPLPLATALDGEGLVWTTGGDDPWRGFAAPSENHDGVDAAASGVLDYDEESWLETTVVGPGTFRFRWKSSIGEDSDEMIFLVDGWDLAWASGEQDWEEVVVPLGAGSHVLTWVHWRGDVDATGSDTVWLDQASFAAAQPVSLTDALDAPGRVWTTGGDAPWAGFGPDFPTHDGVDAASSGSLDDGDEAWLQTTVSGPGRVGFWWRTSSEEFADELTLFLNGEYFDSNSGETDWTWVELDVPPGDHVLRWLYAKNASGTVGADTAWVDGFAFLQAPVVPLAAALDGAGLSWVTGGGASWTGYGPPSFNHDNVDAAASGHLGDGQECWVETTVTGPGTLSFQWMISSAAAADSMSLLIDGRPRAVISGEVPWQPVTATLGEGQHTLRWRYAKDGEGAAGMDTAWLDEVNFTPDLLPPLADALDGTGLQWLSSGTGAWSPQTSVTHDGVDAAKSAAIGDSQQTWLETTVNGPGRVNFWWKVSSQTNRDYVVFAVDGEDLYFVSGDSGWQQQGFDLTGSGVHVLRWRYYKNASLTGNLDAAWLDEVSFTPAPAVALADALDGAGLTWTTGGAGWSGYGPPSLNHDGADAVANHALADSQEGWLETTLTGPGTVGFWWSVSSEDLKDILSFSVDGVELTQLSGDAPWRQVLATVGEGSHTLRWRYRKDASGSGGLDTAWLDQVSFTPDTVPPLVAAFDLPDAQWLSSGDKVWSVQSLTTHDGADAGLSFPAGDDLESWVETRVTGPGNVSFWWKASSATETDMAVFSVGGQPRAEISGEQDWIRVTATIPAGQQTLRWTYKNDGGFPGGGKAWLDEVNYAPQAPPALVAALDDPQLQWTSSGAAAWSLQQTVTHDAVDAARSAALTGTGESWLETRFSGAGELAFWWKASTAEAPASLALTIDGEPHDALSGEVDWQRKVILLGPGNHVVRWSYQNVEGSSGGQNAAWLDEVGFTGAPPVPLDQALDAPELSWETSGDGEWEGLQSAIFSHDGQDVAATGRVPHGGYAWLDTYFEGPGRLSFRWKVSCEEDADWLTFYADDLDVAYLTGETGWQEFTMDFGPGEHYIYWEYAKDLENVAGMDTAWLDQVRFIPAPPVSLAEALDTPDLEWENSGDSDWLGFGSPSPNHDGVDAITHDRVFDESWASVDTTVTGPCTVSFWWKVSSEESSDFLSFLVDGWELSAISGETGWERVTVFLEEGEHELTFIYEKDESDSVGADAGWVDQFTVTPGMSFLAWTEGWELEGADAHPDADGDLDGMALLLEYAFNLDPYFADPFDLSQGFGDAGLPHVTLHGTGLSARLRIEYLRRRTTDISYIPEFSGDLHTWDDSAVIVSVEALDEEWERVVVEDTKTRGQVWKRFGRVRVEYQQETASLTLETWAAGFGLEGAAVDATADDDKDSSPLLLEYAFGMDPTDSDAVQMSADGLLPGMPRVTLAGAGNTARLRVTYLRRRGVSDLAYAVEFANNIVNAVPDGWTPATGTPTVTPVDEMWELVSVEDHESLGTRPKRFARVKVTHLPQP